MQLHSGPICVISHLKNFRFRKIRTTMRTESLDSSEHREEESRHQDAETKSTE